MTDTRPADELTPIRFELRRGAFTATPFAIAVGFFGVSFGILAASTVGIGAVAAIVMSATTFAGSAQFAAVSVLAAGGQPIAAIGAALLLNARYVPIGVTVAPHIPGGLLRRLLTAHLVVDESWAIAADSDGRFDAGRLVGAGLVLWAAWIGGTVIGALGGDALGDPAAFGLDAAFPALFLALLATQLTHRRRVIVAVLGGAIALALVPFAPVGVPIIAAAAAALLGLRR